MKWLKERLFWIGIATTFIIMVMFGLAMMGSVLSAKPSNLPVALVSLDESETLPGGNEVAVGEMITERLLDNEELPVEWDVVNSEKEARQGMEQQEYYGALILPADLSTGVISLVTPNPQSETVKLLINEGMNVQASSAVKEILNQIMTGVNMEVSSMLLEQAAQSSEGIPINVAQAVQNPIPMKEQVLHPIGEKNAQGNAPNLLTQLIWVTCLVTSACMFMVYRKQVTEDVSRRWRSFLSQFLSGLIIVFAASLFLIWMASSWYGMEIENVLKVWLFLWLIGTSFFLLQSTLLNWIGFPAMAILVLLFFFSMPLLNLPPEFLPQVTQDWLYSWTPLRFAASGLNNIMYFGGTEGMSTSYIVLWSISGICLVLFILSPLRQRSTQL